MRAPLDTLTAPIESNVAVEPLPNIRAVLFDVDGTLYRQTPVRLCMAAELLATGAPFPRANRTPTPWQIVRVFRKMREELRDVQAEEPLVDLQYSVAAARLGCSAATVRSVIDAWMFRRPLKYLRPFRLSGIETLLSFLSRRGVAMGVLSDYPAGDKLRALGLEDWFSPVLCTTDPEIDAFKPHPRGFLRACEIWGLTPAEVLYVGDRPETDARGAAAAGMRCAILRRGRPGDGLERGGDYVAVSVLSDLRRQLACI